MKKAFVLLFCALSMLQSSAQTFVKGDMNGDGNVTVEDVVSVVDAAIGKDNKRVARISSPINVCNTDLYGTWRCTTSSNHPLIANPVNLGLDGSLCSPAPGVVYTFEYHPTQGVIVILKNGVIDYGCNVLKITDDCFAISKMGSSTVYYYGKSLTSISMPATASVQVGKTITLSPTFTPSVAVKSVSWSSSDKTIATVSNGVVKGVKVGGPVVVKCTVTDAANKTMSASCKVTVTPAPTSPTLLTGVFSVSSDKKVQFTSGNLYWDGSAYRLEAKQTDYPTKWSANHVGHFFWTTYKDYTCKDSRYCYKPYDEVYHTTEGIRSDTDTLFCDKTHPLTINGESLYVMDKNEWEYLLDGEKRKNLYKIGTVDNKLCLIIAPDGYSPAELKEKYTLDEANRCGLLCLPAAGLRSTGKTEVSFDATPGGYRSSTASDGYTQCVYQLIFGEEVDPHVRCDAPANCLASVASSIRLVKAVK